MIRLYGDTRIGSFGSLTHGVRIALQAHGLFAGLFPCDSPKEGVLYEGGEALSSIVLGPPATLLVAQQMGQHRERWHMLAPNSDHLPASFVDMVRKLPRFPIDDPDPLITGFLTPSAWGKEVISQAFPDVPVHVAPHGVLPEFELDSQLHEQLDRMLANGDMRFLHVTSSDRDRKGTAELMSAWHVCRQKKTLPPGAELVIWSNQHTAQRWIAMRNRMRDDSIHVVMGFANSTRILSRVYQQSHVVIQPSRAEGFGLCLHPDTLVRVKEGVKPIHDVAVGDRVLTGAGRWRRVLARATSHHKNVVRIKAVGVPDLLASKGHRVLASWWNGSSLGDPRWVEAGKLRIGDHLVVGMPDLAQEGPVAIHLGEFFRDPVEVAPGMLRERTGKHALPRTLSLDSTTATVLGLYCAEGSVTRTGAIEFSLDAASKDDKCEAAVRDWAAELGIPCRTIVKERKRRVFVCSKPLATMLGSLCGRSSESMAVPSCVEEAPETARAAFLRGLFWGDGHHEKGVSVRLSSISPSLAFQARDLALSLGFMASVRSRRFRSMRPKTLNVIRRKGKIIKSRRLSWIVSVQGKSYTRMAELLLDPDRKVKRRGSSWMLHAGKWMTPIRSLTTEQCTLELHDLQVEGDETFVANGVIVHNSPLEARACGVPVVATICTGHSEHMSEVTPGVVTVPHGPSVDSDDFPGARAPSVSAVRIVEAIERAVDEWPALHRRAVDEAERVQREWAWPQVMGPALAAIAWTENPTRPE